MEVFPIVLTLATFLCSLVAGFLFAFAVVAMPGLGSLGDRDFLRAFQVMDRVIQNNQPLFMAVWIGSVVAVVTATVLGIGQMDGLPRLLMVCATVGYLVGVQLPTITINVPLNNKLQRLDVSAMNDARVEGDSRGVRTALEPMEPDQDGLGGPGFCPVDSASI